MSASGLASPRVTFEVIHPEVGRALSNATLTDCGDDENIGGVRGQVQAITHPSLLGHDPHWTVPFPFLFYLLVV